MSTIYSAVGGFVPFIPPDPPAQDGGKPGAFFELRGFDRDASLKLGTHTIEVHLGKTGGDFYALVFWDGVGEIYLKTAADLMSVLLALGPISAAMEIEEAARALWELRDHICEGK